ncbi:hypothetical protein GBAR_LOCUS19851 [Geodia barretti]|uniref:BHLH domain-containing protein n=1 Tax=Geodia barretti TaxID=519541 RepID=A0AA35X298_GEOBA|nr:hypothetical protein GBAR_LOCUS19851 [Geodia barretti]
MTDGERPRSEGNASEYDTDFECEEEEVGGVQSDGSSFSEGGQGSGGVAGRKRLRSEAATAAANINLTETSSSQDAKCKQASNLHNEREKERRKDLKQAVHRLRNQLQLHQTKKATTISVLKASELEIKVVNDLVVV